VKNRLLYVNGFYERLVCVFLAGLQPMRVAILVFWGVFISIIPAKAADRQLKTAALTWLRLTNTVQIDSHWIFFSEVDFRFFDKPVKMNTILPRVSARYTFNSGMSIGFGFAGALNFPNDNLSTSNLITPELRPFADLSFQKKYGPVVITHRNLIENRFMHNATATELQPGYKYIFRYRYRLNADFILWQKPGKSVKFILYNEIMLQAGKTVLYNVFDQNRVYAGLYYEPVKYFAMEGGYMHFFQQTTAGNVFNNRHIFRLSLYTKIFVKPRNKA
jgi:hypothetical protein